MSLKDDLKKTGYNLEEIFFERLNRELINQIKSKGTETAPQKQESLAEVIAFRPREKQTEDKKAA
jgi:hypothetical protein